MINVFCNPFFIMKICILGPSLLWHYNDGFKVREMLTSALRAPVKKSKKKVYFGSGAFNTLKL